MLSRPVHIFNLSGRLPELQRLARTFAQAVQPHAWDRNWLTTLSGRQGSGKTQFASEVANMLITDSQASHDLCKPWEAGWDSVFWINRMSARSGQQVRVMDRRAIRMMTDELIRKYQGFRDVPERRHQGIDFIEHPGIVIKLRADIRIAFTAEPYSVAHRAVIVWPRFGGLHRRMEDLCKDPSVTQTEDHVYAFAH